MSTPNEAFSFDSMDTQKITEKKMIVLKIILKCQGSWKLLIWEELYGNLNENKSLLVFIRKEKR